MDRRHAARGARGPGGPRAARAGADPPLVRLRDGGLPTNERLEFLGDAVLGLVVTEALYARHPDLPRASWRSCAPRVVNTGRSRTSRARSASAATCCWARARRPRAGRDKNSILADTSRRCIGAIYLEHGLEVTAALGARLFGPLNGPELGAGLDWKTSLQEITADAGLGCPRTWSPTTGPDHAKQFTRARSWSAAGARRGRRAQQEARRAERRGGRDRALGASARRRRRRRRGCGRRSSSSLLSCLSSPRSRSSGADSAHVVPARDRARRRAAPAGRARHIGRADDYRACSRGRVEHAPAPRQVPLAAARLRRRAPRAPRHERAAAGAPARTPRRGAPAGAGQGSLRRRTGRGPAALRRPADVRRPRGRPSVPTADGVPGGPTDGRCPTVAPHRPRPARPGVRRRRLLVATVRAAHRDQAALLDQTLVSGRRQHLRRRGPVAGQLHGARPTEPLTPGRSPRCWTARRGDDRGARAGRDITSTRCTSTSTASRLVRAGAGAVRPEGRPCPRCGAPMRRERVHEPVVVLLPAVPAPSAVGALGSRAGRAPRPARCRRPGGASSARSAPTASRTPDRRTARAARHACRPTGRGFGRSAPPARRRRGVVRGVVRGSRPEDRRGGPPGDSPGPPPATSR